MKKEKVIVICPGRGSYTKDTLNYFQKFSSPEQLNRERILSFLHHLDSWREQDGYPSLTSLDQSPVFSVTRHTPGEHASTLIYACALMDFMSLNPDRLDVVAVLGNSMGWYLALACASVLDEQGAYQVVQTMGSMMKEKIIGGQIIYPVMREDWTRDQEKERLVMSLMEQINQLPDHECYISIFLGNYLVLAGNEKALQKLQKELPPVEHYPFKLINHAAFHTPMLQSTSQKAFQLLPENLFRSPTIPLVDGRGKIWMPHSSSIPELHSYTLDHQVVAPYDFSTSVKVALKEFAPSRIILLGPGNTLGGAIGQILIDMRWQGIKNKGDFVERQKKDPYLISMGLSEQRSLVL